MYHSGFYDMLYRVNQDTRWRALLGDEEPDIHMKDIEVLLRGFAMLIDGRNYAPSLVRFLNQFSRRCESNTGTQNNYLEELFLSFLDACKNLPLGAFINVRNNRFNMALFEAVFSAISKNAFGERRKLIGIIDKDEIVGLAEDKDFLAASIEGTTRTLNVGIRIKRAEEILNPL
jgi:hypothetical protein